MKGKCALICSWRDKALVGPWRNQALLQMAPYRSYCVTLTKMMLINLFNMTFGCWLFSFMNQGYNGWIKIFSFIRQCAGQGSTRWKLKTVCPVNSKGRSMGLQLEIEYSQDVIQGQKRSTKARTDIWRPKKIAGGQQECDKAKKGCRWPKKDLRRSSRVSQGQKRPPKAINSLTRPKSIAEGCGQSRRTFNSLAGPWVYQQGHHQSRKAFVYFSWCKDGKCNAQHAQSPYPCMCCPTRFLCIGQFGILFPKLLGSINENFWEGKLNARNLWKGWRTGFKVLI